MRPLGPARYPRVIEELRQILLSQIRRKAGTLQQAPENIEVGGVDRCENQVSEVVAAENSQPVQCQKIVVGSLTLDIVVAGVAPKGLAIDPHNFCSLGLADLLRAPVNIICQPANELLFLRAVIRPRHLNRPPVRNDITEGLDQAFLALGLQNPQIAG